MGADGRAENSRDKFFRLAEEYEQSAKMCAERVNLLKEQLKSTKISDMERRLLLRRVHILSEMAADAESIAAYLRQRSGTADAKEDL